jgi:hypothetical protein
VYVLWGIFIIRKRAWFGRWGARSHQRVARPVPRAYGANSPATREGFWRLMAVPMGIFFIAIGCLVAAGW